MVKTHWDTHEQSKHYTDMYRDVTVRCVCTPTHCAAADADVTSCKATALGTTTHGPDTWREASTQAWPSRARKERQRRHTEVTDKRPSSIKSL